MISSGAILLRIAFAGLVRRGEIIALFQCNAIPCSTSDPNRNGLGYRGMFTKISMCRRVSMRGLGADYQ